MSKKKTGNKSFDIESLMTKENIRSALVVLTAVLNLIILCFAIVSASYEPLSGKETFFSNGFSLIFSEPAVVMEEIADFASFYSLIHFIVSLAIIITLVLIAVISRSFRFGGFSLWVIILSLVTSLIYMIVGLVANYYAADFATFTYVHRTFAPLGFVLVFIAALSWILVSVFMTDDNAKN